MTKDIIVSTQGELKFKFLTFQDSNSSHVVNIEEYVINDLNQKYFPIYEYDTLGNRYSIFNIKFDKNSSFRFVGNYTILTSSYPFVKQNTWSYESSKFTKDSNLIFADDSIDNLSKSFLSSTLDQTVIKLDQWISDNIEYSLPFDSFSSAYNVNNAVQMYQKRAGFCVEYSNLAAAILRNLGIPTRIVVGIVNNSNSWGNHAWLELKSSNGDWISYDPTYHEYGYLDATHIRQGVFIDYTDIKDTISANFNVSDISFVANYDPFNLDINIIDSNQFNLDLNLLLPNDVKSNSQFKICIDNPYNQRMIIPIRFGLHNDFNYNNLSLYDVDSNFCISVTAPDAIQDTIYSYNIFYLDKNYSGNITVKSSLPKIDVINVDTTLIDGGYNVNYFVKSDSNTELHIIVNYNDYNQNKYIELKKGDNNFIISLSSKSKDVNILIYQSDKLIQKNVIRLDDLSISYYYIIPICLLILLCLVVITIKIVYK